MIGGCRCKNLRVNWQMRDFSLIPKACQCNYCASKDAAYVAKPGSKFTLSVKHASQYRAHANGRPSPDGEPSAVFHECLLCEELVAVTCTIDEITYGIINVNSLDQRDRFPEAKRYPFVDQALSVRLEHRINNWSYPVAVEISDGHN